MVEGREYGKYYCFLKSVLYNEILTMNGCYWNEDVCIVAAQEGHLEVLKYAHENGCDWNEMTCAAQEGPEGLAVG